MNATKQKEATELTVEVIGPPISKAFSLTQKGLEELRTRLLPLAERPIETTGDYQDLTQAIAEVRTTRTTIEARRQELKAPALEYGRKLDERAREITEALLEIEGPLKAHKQAHDDQKAREKEAKERAEKERVEAIQKKILDMQRLELRASTSLDAEELQAIQEQLDQVQLTPAEFAEFLPQAAAVHDTATQVVKERGRRLEAKAEEDRQRAAEAEALKQKQAELAKQQEELERQRKEQAAREAALRAEEEKARQEQLEREREAREEQERVEREQAEAAAEKKRVLRAKRIKPDQQKLEEIAEALEAVADRVVTGNPVAEDQVQLRTAEGREQWKVAKALVQRAVEACRALA